jgi:DNA-binding NarL/FixJ family response regulator
VSPDLPSQALPIRILVADDFEPWRAWLRTIVSPRDQFHIVGEVTNGLDAVLKAHELRPELILLDINLPSLDGLEVSRRVLRTAPETKIIYVTTNTDPELVEVAMSNGVLGYVLKNEAANDLLRAIQSALRGDKFISSQLRHY